MVKTRRYFVLAARIDGRWCLEFGDFDRATVEAEREDYRDHGHKARDLKVLTVGATDAAAQAAIATLNGEG